MRRCLLRRALDLLARGQEHVAVRERPAQVLRVRELEAIGADLLGERDELVDLVEVRAMEDDVHRERELELLHPAHDLELLRVAGVAGDLVGERGTAALDADLHVIDARSREPLEALAREGNAARDEVHVEAELAGARDAGSRGPSARAARRP